MTNSSTNSPLNGADDRTTQDSMYDVVIIGGGIAGLSVALTLPDDLSIALVTKAALGESNTRYAQGGLAAAVGLDDDPDAAPARHAGGGRGAGGRDRDARAGRRGARGGRLADRRGDALR